jgi:hypothetical protein
MYQFMLVIALLNGCSSDSNSRKVLLLQKTKGYHHESIPAGIAAIKKYRERK